MTQPRPTDDELHQQITSIASSFKVFEDDLVSPVQHLTAIVNRPFQIPLI